MIDYANKQRSELSAFEAIHEAGLRRFRPIILVLIPCLYMILEDVVSEVKARLV